MPWIPCLELVNLESSRSWILSLGRGGSFSIQYEHSMYGAEVREHYLVGQGEIRLMAVETSHPGVAGYYGFDGVGPRYQILRQMPEVVLRLRMGPGRQSLVGSHEVQGKQLGAPGDRVLLRPAACTMARFLLNRLESEGHP